MTLMQRKKHKLPCLFCAVLIAAVLACSLTGCATTSDTGTESTSENSAGAQTAENGAQNTQSVDTDNIYDTPNDEHHHYNGTSFTVLTSSSDASNDIFFSEQEASDVYCIQSAKRNEAVEQKLGIIIQQKTASDVTEYIKETNASGNAPDLVYSSGKNGISEMMLYGCLEDLYEYKDDTLTSVGVSVSVVRQLSVYGKLYMLTGAPIRSSVENTAAVAYNAELMKSMGYEAGYLEELVLGGEWTLDTMSTLIKKAQSQSGSDTFCSVGGGAESLYCMWKGMGALTVEKLNGDVPSVSVYSPKNIYYFERVNDFASDVGEISDNADDPLFYIATIGQIKEKVKHSYGILPMPSYHEGGEYTCVLDFDDTFFTAVPAGAARKQMSLDYLHGFYDLSVDTVYSVTVAENTFGSGEVLDVILKSRYFDFLDMYGIGHIVSTAFYSQTDTDDFDDLLSARAKFAAEALDIALRQTVGTNTNSNSNTSE